MPIKDTDCAATYKVLIVGDSGVGKSAILKCLMGKTFDERWRPTVGTDFVTKIVEADGALIELRVWDTAGLESFRSMTRRQFHGVQGVFLVYDVTDKTSFDSLSYWMSSFPNEGTSGPSSRHSYEPVPFLVLGNKADLVEKKTVGIIQGMKMANTSMAFGFFETSAKTGKNIFTAFHKMAFTITDINHPRLMKSYHRHQIRPLRTKDDVMSTSLPPLSSSASSSFATLRKLHSQPSSPSKSSSQSSSSSLSARRHTVSVMPFSILRTKTRTIKEKAKRKSWSVSVSLPKLGLKRGHTATKNERKQRNSFGGWGNCSSFSTVGKNDRKKSFSSKNRNSGNFSSNIIISDPSMTLEREKALSPPVKKKKTKKGGRAKKSSFFLFACFGKRKKKRKEK